MRLHCKYLVVVLAMVLCLWGAGCSAEEEREQITPPSAEEPQAAVESGSDTEPAVLEPEKPDGNYILQVADQIADSLVTDEMSEPERARAAYDYVIENTHFNNLPLGVGVWRIRGDGAVSPSYLENRALSPMVFGIGSCEDYAAALALLLQRMGMEAVYMPGLTISVDGDFVDHAWTVANIDGTWYHLDPQLEDNIISDGTLKYRYFMLSDETMLADHRWGGNLIAYGGLDQAQIDEIRAEYIPPECPADYPAVSPKTIRKIQKPDMDKILEELERERQDYEAEFGTLDEVELNIVPPVFGNDGYPK